MTDFNDLDRRIIAALSGRDRIKLLLRERGLQLQEFARKHNLWVEQVSQCIRGVRDYPEIRDALAAELGLTRTQIDELIDGARTRSDASEPAA